MKKNELHTEGERKMYAVIVKQRQMIKKLSDEKDRWHNIAKLSQSSERSIKQHLEFKEQHLEECQTKNKELRGCINELTEKLSAYES